MICTVFETRSAQLHCKKRLSFFLSSAGMSLAKLSLSGNRESLVSDIPAGEGKKNRLFLQCNVVNLLPIFGVDYT